MCDAVFQAPQRQIPFLTVLLSLNVQPVLVSCEISWIARRTEVAVFAVCCLKPSNAGIGRLDHAPHGSLRPAHTY